MHVSVDGADPREAIPVDECTARKVRLQLGLPDGWLVEEIRDGAPINTTRSVRNAHAEKIAEYYS